MAALRAALAEIFRRYSQARQHDFAHDLLVLDVDLSPLPAAPRQKDPSAATRSKTGRKLARVRAARSQETIWKEVISGRTAETLSVLQTAIQAVEGLLGLGGDDEAACYRRARTEIRLDSG